MPQGRSNQFAPGCSDTVSFPSTRDGQTMPHLIHDSVNFAFAYIAPGSFEVTTMDGQTPASLFKDTTNLKSIKEDLQVWVSIGGW